MKRELRITGDGSHTLYVCELDEPYHSMHGAVQESLHIFINQGFKTVNKSSVNILEMGFGTGLNMILTLRESEKRGIVVNYHGVEKYPLNMEEYGKLNYDQTIGGNFPAMLTMAHNAPWDTNISLTNKFTLYKELSDFRKMDPDGRFDLVYFDAFAPDKQPRLWSREIFTKIRDVTNKGAVLVSYSSRGSVRRLLDTCGFDVIKIPGPPGKREMIRAIKR